MRNGCILSVYIRVVRNIMYPFTQLQNIYCNFKLETGDKLLPADAPKSSIRLLPVLEYAHLN